MIRGNDSLFLADEYDLLMSEYLTTISKDKLVDKCVYVGNNVSLSREVMKSNGIKMCRKPEKCDFFVFNVPSKLFQSTIQKQMPTADLGGMYRPDEKIVWLRNASDAQTVSKMLDFRRANPGIKFITSSCFNGAINSTVALDVSTCHALAKMYLSKDPALKKNAVSIIINCDAPNSILGFILLEFLLGINSIGLNPWWQANKPKYSRRAYDPTFLTKETCDLIEENDEFKNAICEEIIKFCRIGVKLTITKIEPMI